MLYFHIYKHYGAFWQTGQEKTQRTKERHISTKVRCQWRKFYEHSYNELTTNHQDSNPKDINADENIMWSQPGTLDVL